MRRFATLFQEYRFLDSVRSLRRKTEIRFVESCKLLAIKVVGVQHNARVYVHRQNNWHMVMKNAWSTIWYSSAMS